MRIEVKPSRKREDGERKWERQEGGEKDSKRVRETQKDRETDPNMEKEAEHSRRDTGEQTDNERLDRDT